MKKSLLCTAIIALAAITAKAYQVKAVVADATGEGLPYVTYRVFNAADSLNVLVSDITDDLGVLVWALKAVTSNLTPEIKAKAKSKLQEWFSNLSDEEMISASDGIHV